MQRTKILLIVGTLRSGSTILGNVLGQIDGFFSAGELADIWVNVWHNDGVCGCGTRAADCELWKTVFDQAFGGAEYVDGWTVYQLGRRALRTGALPLMALPLTRALLLAHLQDYLSLTSALYRSFTEHAGAKVVVDHSKYPAYRYVLEALDGIDLYVLHLIRDPRAVVYSWLRRKPHKGGPKGDMYENPLLTSIKWLAWNAVAGSFLHQMRHRYLRIRYEDFVRAPHDVVKQIVEFVEEQPDGLPIARGSATVNLDATHTVAGNPNRFTTGAITLQLDHEWEHGMKLRDRLIASVVTFPLMLRYGYGLRSGPTPMKREDRLYRRGSRMHRMAAWLRSRASQRRRSSPIRPVVRAPSSSLTDHSSGAPNTSVADYDNDGPYG